jgi:hypothetical protein
MKEKKMYHNIKSFIRKVFLQKAGVSTIPELRRHTDIVTTPRYAHLGLRGLKSGDVLLDSDHLTAIVTTPRYTHLGSRGLRETTDKVAGYLDETEKP